MSDWQNRIVGYGEEEPEQLLASPFNHRIHPRRQQDALKGSLDTLGYIQTVIVNKTTQHIVDGHLRVVMAMREGQKSIPVTYVELTPEEEAQALLSLDPIAAMAANDRDKVDELLRMVNTDNADVMKHLADFAAENKLDWGQPEQVDAEPQIDRAAELQKLWGTETGQLWKLGEHRLLVGDCTVRENVERLMGGEMADICVSDPPYGVLDEEWDRYFEQADFDMIASVTDGMIALFNAAKPEILLRMLSISPTPQRVGVWRYSQIMPRPGMIWSWQPVFYWNCKDAKAWDSLDWYQGNSNKDGTHPTQKPIEFFEKIISSVKCETVYEPFAGSGTTIMAAQNLGRRCYAMEISPAYCAVILQRFADATGIQPELVN